MSKQLTVLTVCCFFFTIASNAQVTSSIDTTKIKIGEQITYKIQVEADTTDLVVFPEGQTFTPLEMIESYKVDTTKNNARFKLIKKYGLTQFDSGSYMIPKQKVVIGTKTVFTDSLNVEVFSVAVDTTKQNLYDIKPLIKVEKGASNWWIYLLITLMALGLIGFLLYWFIWRKKPLTEEEEIAMLPPYDRAKLALKKLDESNYLQRSELKDYYSELTFIIRKYLDEKVYDRALESTTDELVDRLNMLKDANQIELSQTDIDNIETILKRADLVKFAKSAPDIELARIDRDTIDVEIDQVKEALPEPTEEEKLLNKQYKEEQDRKKKREKIVLTVCASILILVATYVGFGLKYGFKYVADTIIGNETKELLEGDWVKSDYGVPPIMISTPVVLERIELQAIDTIQQVKRTAFGYGDLDSAFNIGVGTTQYNLPEGEEIDINGAVEETIKSLENNGARNLIVKQEQFITPNAAEGLKVFGTGEFPTDVKDQYRSGEYLILIFVADDKSVMQKVALIWNNEDEYTNQIMDRILNSVELKKVEE
uniref:BatD family protein n=1 Tax=Psychroserpens luteolus TaxID=2855840 RepID=UPI001E4C2683|nr:BatD family protein [Psychroserpens luteolus]